jgi:hypothetical protein
MPDSHGERGSFLTRLLGSPRDNWPNLPVGDEYLHSVEQHETAAEKATDTYLPTAGEKVPKTWRQLWSCLAALDGLSSCWWGCAGGDHAVERLLARVLGSVRAAIRLARAGLYDEGLNALRTAGEVVNLLTLMSEDPELLSRWREASPPDRFRLARPTTVMKALKELGREESSLNLEKYDLLSRIAHGNTDSTPQAYNVADLALIGGRFQEAGFIVVLNEAALLVALGIVSGVALVELEPEVRRDVLLKGQDLVESTGSITIATLGEALEYQRTDALGAYESGLSKDG